MGVLVLLQTTWFYLKASVIVSVIWCGYKRTAGLSFSMEFPVTLGIICSQYGISNTVFTEVFKGFIKDTAIEFSRLGIPGIRMTIQGQSTSSVAKKKKRKKYE